MAKEKSPIIEVIKNTGPAVVAILPLNSSLEKLDKKQKFPLGGSGFFVSKDGLILTNRHVVLNEKINYKITTINDEIYEAEILATDRINDIAILKIKEKNLPIIELGNSEDLELGQTVIAIGNILGTFQNTVSSGIISGLSRFIKAVDFSGQAEQLRGLIQTDAAFNPGNSGGPLVDIFGKAIGINAAMILGAQNVGFAIPINRAKKDLEDLKKYGRIIQPFLGIRYILINKELKEKFRLPVDYGALVIPEITGEKAVIPNSPAAKAGLREKDIILEFDGQKITEKTGLIPLLLNCKIGEVVSILILRNNREKKLKVKIEERVF